MTEDRPRTVGDVLRDFLQEHVDLATSTVSGYRSVVTCVISHPVTGIDQVPVSILTGAYLTAWRRDMTVRGVSPANRRLAFAVLRSALSWDVESGRLTSNPALGLTTRRTKAYVAERTRDAVRLPTWSDVAATASAIPDRSARLMYLVFAFSGPRASELFALRPEGVLDSSQEVELREVWAKPKGQPWRAEPLKAGIPRRAQVPAGLFGHLARHRDAWTPPSGSRVSVLFRPPRAVRHGPGIWTNELWRTDVMVPASVLTGLTHRTKDLRAFAASMLVDVGATQVEAQHLLGHSSPDTTQRHYIRAQSLRAHDPVRAALRVNPSLSAYERLDALWDAFIERFGDPLSLGGAAPMSIPEDSTVGR